MSNVRSTAPRVFISSATGQLAEYRAAVIDVCRRYSYEPVFMEDFVPDRAAPAQYCREKVGECDAMVMLLAHRYGSLVPGEERSYTELEYDTALQLPDLKLLVWVVDEQQPWLPAEVDQGVDRARLDRFKDRARQHTVGSFAGLSKFREDIGFALAGLRHGDGGASRAAQQLTQAIRLRHPKLPEVAAFPAYVGSMDFTGRATESVWLDQWAQSSDPVAVIEAIGGTGKSALTWDWFSNSAPDLIPGLAGRFWWSFYEGSNSMRKFQQTLLIYATGCPHDEAEALDALELAEAVLHALEQQPFLVVLDGFERLLNAYHRFDAGTVTDDEVEELRLVYARAMTDPAAHDFVRRLTGLRRTRVLISTRLLPDPFVGFSDVLRPGVRHMILPGLRTGDTSRLLDRMGVRHSRVEAKTFFDRLDNHPLLIGIVAGLVRNYRPAPGDFDAWLADPHEGGRFSVAEIPITARSHHILEHALAGLQPLTLQLLRRISVPGGVTTWDMLQAINPFLPHELTKPAEWSALPEYLADFLWQRRTKRRAADIGDPRMAISRLDVALRELQDRGLLWWDHDANTYDLHPVVRAYTFETTEPADRRTTFERLVRDHFGRLRNDDDPDAAQSVEDLLTTIQYFRALAGSGLLEQAAELWQKRLSGPLVFRLGAHLVAVQLLREAAELAHISGGNTTFEWDLALAEGGAGHLEEARERQLRVVERLVAGDAEAAHVLAAINNLIVDSAACLRSAAVHRYLRLLAELTEVSGTQPGDVARLNSLRVDELLEAELDQQALDLVEKVLVGPENPMAPNWRADLLAMQFEALDRVGRGAELGSIEVGACRFGPASESKLRWASFVARYAERRGDFALAYEAALECDRWTRRLGRESLPADAAWALAGLGRHAEAADLLEATLLRFDRVHFALRPHYEAARTLILLGRPGRATPHALAAYRQAWRDGPPTQDRRWVRLAGELLDELAVPRPSMRSIDPDRAKFRCVAEIAAYISRLRDKPIGPPEGKPAPTKQPDWLDDFINRTRRQLPEDTSDE